MNGPIRDDTFWLREGVLNGGKGMARIGRAERLLGCATRAAWAGLIVTALGARAFAAGLAEKAYPSSPRGVVEAYCAELVRCAGMDPYEDRCPELAQYLTSPMGGEAEEEETGPPPECIEVVSGFRIAGETARGEAVEVKVAFERVGELQQAPEEDLRFVRKKQPLPASYKLTRQGGIWKIDLELDETGCLIASLPATLRDLEAAAAEAEEDEDDVRRVLVELKRAAGGRKSTSKKAPGNR